MVSRNLEMANENDGFKMTALEHNIQYNVQKAGGNRRWQLRSTTVKVAPWWPTLQGFHAVALLCAPCYRVPAQYLCESWSTTTAE